MSSGDRHVVAPHGAWPSPFPLDVLVHRTVRLLETQVDGDAVLWLEGRPGEGGRQALVRRDSGGSTEELSPVGMNVRTRVHEYGGGAYAARDGVVVASSFADGRVHRIAGAGRAAPLTPAGAARYADFEIDPARGRVVCVREDHSEPGREPVNALVAIPLDGSGAVETLVSGADFYAAPRLSNDGRRLAWLSWNHPNLPWDGTSLWLAELDEVGRPAEPAVVLDGQAEGVWCTQPSWAPDGDLWFVAERTGWLNLQRLRHGAVEAVAPIEAELAHPDWTFGLSTYAFVPAEGEPGTSADAFDVLAVARADGRDRLVRIDPREGTVAALDTPWTEIEHVRASGSAAVFVASSPTEPNAAIRLDLASGAAETLRWSTDLRPDPADLSIGRPIGFPSSGGRTAHGTFYPPRNRAASAPPGSRPPLVVTSHGGPTSAARSSLAMGIQILTSRGIAVLDVDYGGSTGYGREYRRSLEGEWGIVDVDDCVAGARWLADRGEVDGARLGIEGGSASGYTTLAALAFTDVFAAGVSSFGIGDLVTFVRDTHKFESRYLERLVGPYPEMADVYRQRSPLAHADRIDAPVLILQGLDDRVVPPSQAEQIVSALRERHVPHAYLPFPGEGHGFRASGAIIRASEAELSFYGHVFGFTPADPIEPIVLER